MLLGWVVLYLLVNLALPGRESTLRRIFSDIILILRRINRTFSYSIWHRMYMEERMRTVTVA